MASARPFQFTNLVKLTRAQVALFESMCLYISERPMAPGFIHELEGLLGQIFRGGCRIMRGELRAVSRSEINTLTPQLGCFAIVGAQPSAQKIIVDMDAGLCALAIDRILGGAGDAARMQRPWTDVETGILSFVLLQLIAQVQAGMHSGRELSLTLDRVVTSLDTVAEIVDQASGYHQLGYRLDLGGRIGYGRILIPDGLVSERFSATPKTPTPTAQELVGMRRNLLCLRDAAVQFRAIVTHLDLSLDDIANVEVGDIIVLEEHRLKKTPDGIEGEVYLKLGSAKHAHLVARLNYETSGTHLEIIDMVSTAHLEEEPMAEGDNAPETQDNLAETEGLLRDVDASVAVELGRIRMSTAQVIRLKKGQMLRLARSPNDPVDLVVNGKLFAKGELIEVDGELGVRLTQLNATD
jgi:flagellar motor switch protein FliM